MSRELPIIFSAPMVRAILAGTKSQTRRICKPAATLSRVVACQDPATYAEGQRPPYITPGWFGDEDGDVQFFCPYGQPGDRLYVREGFSYQRGTGLIDRVPVWYWADGNPTSGDWSRPKPSIHMPRWASRITLEITGIRVERLQDISEADANAEGVKHSLHLPGGRFARENFAHLWWTIHGDGSWEANPWVWVVDFRRLP